MQQHDKAQIEWKQQLADVKKKLLDSQAEIVKLHCKLQEVFARNTVIRRNSVITIFQFRAGRRSQALNQLSPKSNNWNGVVNKCKEKVNSTLIVWIQLVLILSKILSIS